MDIGQEIRGYQLTEKIGAGGFGTVFRAHQQVIDREVAIKIIRDAYANDAEFIRRFETEARLVARLEHPHIVPLYDYWREPDQAYLIMRYLAGSSLRDVIRQGRLSTGRVLRVFNQICPALHIAHQQDVIHRDIKPQNILFDNYRNAYLTDFGIALNLQQSSDNQNDVLRYATVEYTAPEQWTERSASPLSDIYSLGIVLYEMFTGDLPHRRQTTTRQIERHVYNPLPSLRIYRQDIPTDVDAIIWKATAKRPENRYTDVLAFMDALQAALPENDAPPETDDAPSHPASDGEKSNTAALSNATQDVPFRTADLQSIGGSIPRKFVDNTPDTRLLSFEPERIQNPYKGLRAFEVNDAEDFFGRDTEAEDIIDSLEHASFMCVIGPGGSGKSSLVKAGVIPRIRQGAIKGSKNWFISQMTPGATPAVSLSEALSGVAVRSVDNLSEAIRQGDDTVTDTIRTLLPGDNPHLLLFIDQFEELFTLCTDEQHRQHFLEVLHRLVTMDDNYVSVILTLRADFYDRPLQYTEFGQLMRQQTAVLLPLSVHNLEDVIRKPARRVNLTVAPELVAQLVEDVYKQPGALPLLQYTLTELYEQRNGDTLNLESYHKIGGISGALAQRAQTTYELFDEDEAATIRNLFLRMVTIEDRTPTRRRVRWQDMMTSSDSQAQMQRIIDTFAAHRLLTLDRDPVTRLPTVEIAHEALIDAWDELQNWVTQNQMDLQRRKQVQEATRQWLNSGRDESYLAQGSRLAEFEHLLTHRIITLSDDERSYLQKSVALRQRQKQRTRFIIGVLTVLLILAGGFGIIAYDRQQEASAARSTALQERDRASEAAREARSRELAASASANRDDLDLSLLLSVQAVQTDTTYEARNSLLQGLQVSPFLTAYRHGHTAGIRDTAIDGSGQHLVSVDADGMLIRWNTASDDSPYEPLQISDERLNAVALSPDSQIIAAGGAEGSVILLDFESGDVLHEFSAGDSSSASPDAIWSLDFHPRGQWLTAGTASGRLMIWDVPAEAIIQTIPDAHDGIIYAVAFQPQTDYLATAGEDTRVRLWPVADLASDDLRAETLSGHDNWVLALAFHPQEPLLLSSDAEGRVLVHNLESSNSPQQLNTPLSGFVRSLAFGANGRFLALVDSTDSRVYVWDTALSSLASPPIEGHTDGVWSVVFHPDELELFSAGSDTSLIHWSLPPPYRPARVLHQIEAVTESVAIHAPTGQIVSSSSSQDGAVLRVHTADAQQQQLIRTPYRTLLDVTMSQNGQYVAAVADQTTLLIWNLDTGDSIEIENAHAAFMTDVIFSIHSDRLLTADEDGLIKQWSTEGAEAEDAPLPAQASGISHMALSPSGDVLVTGGRDGSIIVRDRNQQTRLFAIEDAHSNAVTAFAFTPDGQQLISGGRDNRILAWDLTADDITPQLIGGMDDWILSLAVRDDGQMLAAGSRNNSIQLYDLTTSRPLGQRLAGHGDWITDLAFFDEQHLLRSISRDGRLITWETDAQDWIQQACETGNRSLTLAEWEQYGTGQPYQPGC
jgi:WD40 repeat protein/serine/threonine protein kinase